MITTKKATTVKSKAKSSSIPSELSIESLPKKVTTKKAQIKAIETSEKLFPAMELKEWLATHHEWNHQDWLTLLKELEEKGYNCLTSTSEGQTKIGEFLEGNRGGFLNN